MVFDILMLIWNAFFFRLAGRQDMKVSPSWDRNMRIFFGIVFVFWLVYLAIDIHRWPTRIWF